VEALHPAQPPHEPVCVWQLSQVVAVGVPVHFGGALNIRGAEGCSLAGDLQQIWWAQSLSSVHSFVHVAAQIPRQQRGVVVDPAQSSDDAHDRGHDVLPAAMHTPRVAREGSTRDAEVQQNSPAFVLQSASAEHPVGHWLAAVQMGVE
jgi:hypothetical protein